MFRTAEGTLAPCSDGKSLLEAVPELKTIAEIDVMPLANIDSSSLQPDLWVPLAKAIYERMGECDGFVVTHGTDTLSYTAAVLSFMLQELGKPVIVTGAQLPLEDLGSDGRTNLINSFRVAAENISGVLVVFGSLVINGTRAKKTSAFDLQAFTSANVPPLGTIGLSIRFSDKIRPRSRKKGLFQPFLNPDVGMLSVYPGLKPEIMSYLVSTHSGIVLEGYGAGNIPTEERSLLPAIREACERNVPVVVCTQCLVGSTEMEVYKVGKVALDAGAIPAMDMTPETTLVKLMWVLGQTKEIQTVASLMQKSFAGELHEII